MLTEKAMEDAIAQNPERYLETGLTLKAQQYRIGDYIFDLLFEDRHGAKLIVELQKGTLDRNHTYKILDYYDEYKNTNPEQFVDIMIIANKIPRERRARLSSYGIAFKEIPETDFPQIPRPIIDPPPPPPAPTGYKKMDVKDPGVWNKDALAQVESWLSEVIRDCSVGDVLDVGKAARQSRKVAHILPEGNIEGFRHILSKLASERYVELTDRLHFKILRKPEQKPPA